MHSDDNSDDTVEEGTQPTQLNEVPPDGNNGDDDVEDLSEDTHVAVQGLIGIGSDGAQEKQKESRAISIHEKDNSQVEGEEEVKHIKVKRSKDIIHNIPTGGFCRTEGIKLSNAKGKGTIKKRIKDQMPTTDTAAMLMLRYMHSRISRHYAAACTDCIARPYVIQQGDDLRNQDESGCARLRAAPHDESDCARLRAAAHD